MRFNSSTKSSSVVQNHEGAKAYSLTPELDLYKAVVTTSLSPKFYESEDDRIGRIRELIKRVDPLFVARLAVYAREQMYLRSVPVMLAVELAKVHSGDSLVKKTVGRVIQRADEITELLAYYQMGRTGTKKLNQLSKQVQHGLGIAFNKFSAYQFAKYNRDSAISLKDALFIVHPIAKDDAQQSIFDMIATDTLPVPETWEVRMTQAGKDGTEKKAVWESLIAEDKLGYMAMLRNLRNILEAEVSTAALEKVCAKIANGEEVRKSKQFPFRFLAAFQELQSVPSMRTGTVLNALEGAIDASIENIEGFGPSSSVFIACDVSGSMDNDTISDRSSIRIKQVGLVLAMLLQKKCKAVMTGAFASTFAMLNLPSTAILANAQAFDRLNLGGSTNGHLALVALLEKNIEVDKVMFFTDCQLWDSTSWGNRGDFAAHWHEYKKRFPSAQLYIFDLAGYGNTPISTVEKDVYIIAGWSDRIFYVLDAIEHGSDALKVIGSIDL